MTKLTQSSKDSSHITTDEAFLVQKQIDVCAKKLNLNHWTHQVSITAPDDGHLMECRINRARSIATYRISREALESSPQKRLQLIYHEVLHTLFDPMRYEHERVHGTDDRFMLELEKAVEHLSKIMYLT